MIDRNNVAREKLLQAAALMKEQHIDLWLVYARERRDPAMELLFNCALKSEVLFMIWQDGRVVALAEEQDVPALEKTGLYTRVLPAGKTGFMQLFLQEYKAGAPNKMALNTSQEDARCDGLGLGLYRRLQQALGDELPRVETSSYPMLEALRAVKTESEVAIMQECSNITCDVYDEIFAKVHVGMSETDVGNLMMAATLARGADGTGIGDPTELPLICITRCGLAHRKPSPGNIIQPGDVMVIDFSVRYNGYTSDVARTMYFLKKDEQHAPPEVKHVIESAIKAVGEVLAMIRPGVHGYDVDEVGRGSIVASGYPPFGHNTGHQVGLECHDGGTLLGPATRQAATALLRQNEVYAIEPTVLQDRDKPSAIVEDDVLLTENGYRLLSRRQTAVIEIPYREAN